MNTLNSDNKSFFVYELLTGRRIFYPCWLINKGNILSR